MESKKEVSKKIMNILKRRKELVLNKAIVIILVTLFLVHFAPED